MLMLKPNSETKVLSLE